MRFPAVVREDRERQVPPGGKTAASLLTLEETGMRTKSTRYGNIAFHIIGCSIRLVINQMTVFDILSWSRKSSLVVDVYQVYL